MRTLLNLFRRFKGTAATLAFLRGMGMSWTDSFQFVRLNLRPISGGATWIHDLWNSVLVAASLKPQTIAATTNGAAVDMADCEGQVFLVVTSATVTDGGYTFTLEESTASGGTYTALALTTAIAEIITTNDETVYTGRAKRTKRFVRVVCTESTAGTTGGVFAALVISMKKAPVA